MWTQKRQAAIPKGLTNLASMATTGPAQQAGPESGTGTNETNCWSKGHPRFQRGRVQMAQGQQGKPNGNPKNCWEVIHCGREVGGANCVSLGVCPTATDERLDGINGGCNGGRVCWTVPGTQVHWGAPSYSAPKALNCLNCSFLHLVESEEGPRFSFLTEAANRLVLTTHIT